MTETPLKKTFILCGMLAVLVAGTGQTRCDAAAADERSAFEMVSQACQRAGEKGVAVAQAQQFLKQYPGSTYRDRIFYIMGMSCGTTDEAIGYFKKAAAGSDRQLTLSSLYMLGQCSFNLDRYDDAVNYFSKIVEQNPRHFLARESLFGLAHAYLALDRLKDAEITLNRLIGLDPYYERLDKTVYLKGLLHFKQKNYADAHDNFQMLTSTAAMYYQARCLQEQQKYIPAVVMYKQLLSRPQEPALAEEVSYLVADCFFLSPDYASAINEYKSFVEKFPASRYKEAALAKIGCCYFQQKAYSDAILAFKDLVREFPKGDRTPIAQYLIGESYLLQDNLSEALNAYGTLIKEYPKSPIAPLAYYKIGWCFTKQKSTDPAIGMYSQFISRYPAHELVPYALMLVGDNYQQDKKFEQAVTYYKQVLNNSARTEELTEVALFMITKDLYDQKKYNDIVSNYHYILNTQPPSDSEWRAYTYLLVADADYYLGLYDESEKVYDLVLKNFPYGKQATLAQDGKAWVYFQQKEYALAKRERQALMEDQTVQQSTATKISSEFEMGNILFNEKKYVEALDAFEKFTAAYPDHALVPEALFCIGRCYYKLEYYTKAIQSWEKMIAAYKDHPRAQEAMNLVADTYFRAQKYTESVEMYRKIIETYPDTDLAKQARLRIAQSYYNAQDYTKSIDAFEQYMNQYPEDAAMNTALDGIVMAAYRLGEGGSSADTDIPVLQRFIEKYPKSRLSGSIQYRLAERYYEKKDFARAAEEFKKATELASGAENIANAYFYLGESLYQVKNYGETAAAFDRFVKNFPQHESIRVAYFHMANSYYYQDKFVEAAHAYEALTTKAGGATDDEIAVTALLNTALCYRKAAKWEEAALVYQRFINQYPKSDMLKNTFLELAGVYETLKHYDQCVATYNCLLAQLPADDPMKIELEYRVAELLLKQDKADEGIQELQKLLSLEPKSDPWRLTGIARLAQEYENKKDWANARASYEEIIGSAKEAKWITAAQERINSLKELETGK